MRINLLYTAGFQSQATTFFVFPGNPIRVNNTVKGRFASKLFLYIPMLPYHTVTLRTVSFIYTRV